MIFQVVQSRFEIASGETSTCPPLSISKHVMPPNAADCTDPVCRPARQKCISMCSLFGDEFIVTGSRL